MFNPYNNHSLPDVQPEKRNVMNLDYVKKQRGLDFIELGMRVELAYGSTKKQGIIKGGNSSGNIDVLFDGEKKPENCHPTWAMKYFDKKGNVIAEFLD